MRYAIIVLTILGMTAASLALREHYRTDTSPCSINDKWDCGIVNQSPYAELSGVPVAVLGMLGYLAIALLAAGRRYRLTFAASLGGFAFSLYLTHVEAHVLQVWCIYCVASLVVISITVLMALTAVVLELREGIPAKTGARG